MRSAGSPHHDVEHGRHERVEEITEGQSAVRSAQPHHSRVLEQALAERAGRGGALRQLHVQAIEGVSRRPVVRREGRCEAGPHHPVEHHVAKDHFAIADAGEREDAQAGQHVEGRFLDHVSLQCCRRPEERVREGSGARYLPAHQEREHRDGGQARGDDVDRHRRGERRRQAHRAPEEAAAEQEHDDDGHQRHQERVDHVRDVVHSARAKEEGEGNAQPQAVVDAVVEVEGSPAVARDVVR